MSITHVLIDFENVQPEGLSLLKDRPSYTVHVFIGATQTTVPVAKLLMPLQDLGARGKVIQATGTGPNALDFHIAFTLGQLSEIEKEDCFRIISKDKGFDPLVAHLIGLGRKVARHESVQAMLGIKQSASPVKEKSTASRSPKPPRPTAPMPSPTPTAKPSNTAAKQAHTISAQPPKTTSKPETAAQVGSLYLKMLKNPKSTRPGTLTRLRNDILSKHPETSAQIANAVVALLKNLRHISIDEADKVAYHLDAAATETTSDKKTPQELCRLLIDRLDKRKNSRTTQPKSRSSLASFIRSSFSKQQLADEAVSDIISAMHDKGFFTVNADGKITWPTS